MSFEGTKPEYSLFKLADRKSTKRHPESDAEVEDDNMEEEI